MEQLVAFSLKNRVAVVFFSLVELMFDGVVEMQLTVIPTPPTHTPDCGFGSSVHSASDQLFGGLHAR